MNPGMIVNRPPTAFQKGQAVQIANTPYGTQGQQGTTKSVWGMVSVATAALPRTLNVFQDTTKSKPYSNLTNNFLPFKEMLTIKYIKFGIVTEDAVTATELDDLQNFDDAAISGLWLGSFDLKIANNVVLTDQNLASTHPDFNPLSQHGGAAYWMPMNTIVIPAETQFDVIVTDWSNTGIANAYLFVEICGWGTQQNLKGGV